MACYVLLNGILDTYVEYQEMLFRSGLLSSYVCNLHMSS